MAQVQKLSTFCQIWIFLLGDFTLYNGNVAQMMTISEICL